MKRVIKIVPLLMMFSWCAYGLGTLVDASLEVADIMIGEQTVLRVSVTADRGREVVLPLPAGVLMPGVEVLGISEADTSLIDNDRMVITRDLLITSFDSSLYLLPPFVVIDGMDTVYSDQLALKVSTVPVNVESPEEFYDIKSIWTPAFVWTDYVGVVLWILLGLLALLLAWYFIRRYRAKKPLLPFGKSEPELPPYEEAMRELDRIRQSRIWSQGLVKEYHTELTDVLRNYMHRRYGFNAKELTSQEIMDELRRYEEDKSARALLEGILSLADFVKFAKLSPLPDENDASLSNAYQFIDKTRVIEEKNEQGVNSQTGESDNQPEGSRRKPEGSDKQSSGHRRKTDKDDNQPNDGGVRFNLGKKGGTL
jgi:hypothetical protein